MSPRRAGSRRFVGIVAVAAFPWIPFVPDSTLGSANVGASYALVAISLTVLTGWVGQISLGHGALVGIGAYVTGHAAGGLGIAFPASALFAMVAGAIGAALMGVVALRIRGLYLAVVTLVFSWMASEFLFRQRWFVSGDQIPDTPIGPPDGFPRFDLTDRRTFFVVAWMLVLVAAFVANNVRDSKTGRAFFAIRGSELAAASLGIDVARYKLIAFVVSGAMAGLAGNLAMTDARVVTADSFTFSASLLYLSIAVVGGLATVSGAIASGLLFAALNELFFQVSALGGYLELVSALLLGVTLLGYRGGLSAAGLALGRRFVPAPPGVIGAGSTTGSGSEQTDQGGSAPEIEDSGAGAFDDDLPVLEATGVTVRFGGLVAVDEATLSVRRGRVVGLIGPNGAGKTTLFNAIAGYVAPTAGRILLHGEDVTRLDVHERAERGMARTFQLIQLFPQLTVRANLLVATHAHDRTGVFAHVAATDASLTAEHAARIRVQLVIDEVGLSEVADRPVAGLPFGVLRMVEVARALVTGFDLIMLDEPASGLDDIETDALIDVITDMRGKGRAQLIIEHDIRMVLQVCDFVYVLDHGRIIAAGTPEEIRGDPSVIAAYLGDLGAEEIPA